MDFETNSNSSGTNTRKRTSEQSQGNGTAKTARLDKRKHQKLKRNKKTGQKTILQWNICGLKRKAAELQLLIKEHDPMVMAIQETLFNDKKYELLLEKDKYIWTLQAGQNAARNGVAIAIKKNVPHKVIKITNTKLQAVAVRTLGTDARTYVSIYVSPRKLTAKVMKEEITKIIDQIPKPFLLMGDFNAHSTEWGSFKTDRWGRAILEIVEELDLIMLNNGSSTRISKNYTCMSAIDLTISSKENQPTNWKVDNDCRGSDHFPIIMKGKGKGNTYSSKQRWDLNHADWGLFQSMLIEILRPNEDYTVERITKEIIRAATAAIPKCATPEQKKLPWWNSRVAECIRNRRKALKKFKNYTRMDKTKRKLGKKLRKARDIANDVIHAAKMDSWESFLTSLDKKVTGTKELWNKIHALSGKKKHTDITLVEGTEIIEDTSTVTEKLANYFYEQSATKAYPTDFLPEKSKQESKPLNLKYESEKDYNRDFTMEELNRALNEADGKAAGIDTISYDMLRKVPLETKVILLSTYNQVWNKGEIPEAWKTGLVIPIPKDNSNPHDARNYRPITLLSCMGKILERMINRRLITELEEKFRLAPNQFAFRPGKSTNEYFIELEGIISPEIRKRNHVECALLDISKAYDRAWRRPILDQLKKWKIEGNMIKYIESFLTDRKFAVEIGNIRSDLRTQENGIPQGAVLSVTLFLVAMNSVTRAYVHRSGTKIIIYADDILVIVYGKCAEKVRARLQKTVNNVNKWAGDRGFTIAPQKSKILHICSKPKHNRRKIVTIEKQKVPEVKSAKLLGVTLDNRFNFKQHMKELKKSLTNRCNMIKIIGGRYRGANRKTMMEVFNSMVLSKILYGAHLYSSSAENVWSIIEPQYNQTIRMISGALRTSPVSSILAETGALPLDLHIKLSTITKAIRWSEMRGRHHLDGEPLMERANSFAIEITGEPIPKIAKRKNTLGIKWYEPKAKIDWSIKRKIKAGGSKRVARQIFRETLRSYANHNKLYTDGSVMNDQVGCGIYDTNTEASIKLNKMCTIFSAESKALLQATKMAVESEHPSIIFSDSAGCLAALEKGESRHPWIEETIRTAMNKDITYCWVPSHVGIDGNEKADKAAGEGRLSPNEYTWVPSQDAINWYTTRVIWANNDRWLRESTSFLKHTKPTTLPGKDRESTKDQRVLTRLRIGHTWLSHGYILHKEDQPRCNYCNDILTANHLILQCSQYDECRKRLKIFGLEIYNNTEESERKLLEFIKENKLINQL